MVAPQVKGLTPTEEEVDDARWVLEQVRALEATSDTWREAERDGRAFIIDRYEAARAEELLEWAAACAERDRYKEEAVTRTRGLEAAQGTQGGGLMAPLIRRSNLLVPVTDVRAVAGSWQHDADAVSLDLAAGVADSRKKEARSRVAGCIPEAAKGGAEVFVRVNRAFAQADVEAAVVPGLSGVILPGVETAADIEEMSALLGRLEGSKGLAAGELQIIALLETALGLWNIREILSCDGRVTQAGIDENALAENMGIYPDRELDPFVYARGRLAIEATALEVQPVGVAYPLGGASQADAL